MSNINLENIQQYYKPYFNKIYYNENYIILLFFSILLLYFNPYLYLCILIAHGMFYINFETFDFNIKLNVKNDKNTNKQIEINNSLFNFNEEEDYEQEKNVENNQSKLYNLLTSEVEKKFKDNKESENLIDDSKKFLINILDKNLDNQPELDIESKLLIKKNIEDNLKKLEEFNIGIDDNSVKKDDTMIVNHPLQ